MGVLCDLYKEYVGQGKWRVHFRDVTDAYHVYFQVPEDLEYRYDVLPDVVREWAGLPLEDVRRLARLNDHLVVSFEEFAVGIRNLGDRLAEEKAPVNDLFRDELDAYCRDRDLGFS